MDNLGSINQTLTKSAEDLARIERALAPSRTLADLVGAIQPPAFLSGIEGLAKAIQLSPGVVAIAEIAKAMQPPAHLTAVSQMMTAMQRQHRLFAELAPAPRIPAEMTKQIAECAHSVRASACRTSRFIKRCVRGHPFLRG